MVLSLLKNVIQALHQMEKLGYAHLYAVSSLSDFFPPIAHSQILLAAMCPQQIF
jgi:hypothetical protein